MDVTKNIEKMMSACYIPTLADSVRLYKEYKPTTSELAACLSDAYDWLTQEPICMKYKNGELYLRCEMTIQDVLAVHYVYVNNYHADINIVWDEFYAPSIEFADITDFTLKELAKQIKEIISIELEQLTEILNRKRGE